MSTTHPTIRTTEWDDAQIKYGNYAPPEKEIKNEEISMQHQEIIGSIDPLAGKTLQQLDEMESSNEKLEDEIARHRQKRLEELRAQRSREKFGEITDVGMCDYVKEITEASREALVICLLYKHGVPECELMNRAMQELARRHKDVKFCRGISDQLVPNFKDSNLPALVIYQEGTCIKQIIGTSFFGGSKNLSADVLDWLLAKRLKLFRTELLEDPREGATGSTRAARGRKGVILGQRPLYSDSEDSGRERRRARNSDSERSEESEEANELRNTGAHSKGYGDSNVERVIGTLRNR